MKIEISNDKSSATIDGVEYELKKVRQPTIQCVTCGKEQYPCEHNEGKKMSEWLNDLPDGYRELALANFKEQGKKDKTLNSIDTSLREFSDWHKTKEGNDFWYDVMSFYIGTEDELPPLPKPKFEVWKPKEGMECWYLSIIGEIKPCVIISNSVSYRYHQTKEQAIEAHEKAMFNYEVEMFIKEKNEGWLPDYSDSSSNKYRIVYDVSLKRLSIEASNSRKHVSDEKVPKTLEIGEEIIAKFDNEKLVKYWI